MATIDEKPLGKVLNVLRPALQSVELRAVAVEQNGQWELATGVITATRSSVSAIRQTHQELRARGSIQGADHFEIVLEVVPIDDLTGMLDLLDSGILSFAGRTFQLRDPDPSSIGKFVDRVMRGGHALSLAPDGGLFPRYTISLTSPRPPEQVIRDAGFEPSDLALSAWWELNEFLGMPLFDRQTTRIRLGLALSVYAAFDPIATMQDGVARTGLHAHKSFRNALMVRGLVRQIGASQTYPTQSSLIRLAAPKPVDDIDFFDVRMEVDLHRLGSQDYIEFLLFHKDLGQLNLAQPGRVYPEQLRYQDPGAVLVRALEYFEGGQRLAEYLGQSRHVKNQPLNEFEAGILMVLAAINVHHVPLMIYREAEHIRDGGRDRGSADIIGVDPVLGLLVIDCTTNVPDTTKIQKAGNTAQYLGARLGTNCRAILVCGSDITLLRQESAKYGVAFVDASHLQAVWSTARSGNTILALNQFRSLIRGAL